MRRWTVGGLVIVSLIAVSPAEAGKPSAKEILARAAAQYDSIRDYTVDAAFSVDSPSVHVPELNIKVYYKKPDKLHIESKDGFAVLPRQGVVVGNPLREFMRGADLTLVGSERILARDCHVIKASFRDEGGRCVQSTVWIDKKRWLAVQTSANPDWGPSVKVKLWYVRVGGNHWLPRKTSARVTLPPIPGAEPDREGKPQKPSTVTIEFANYRVNTGLSDKIFEKREGRD